MTSEITIEKEIEQMFGPDAIAAFRKRDALRAREEAAIQRLLGVEAR